MQRQNITLSIPKDLLREVKIAAAEQSTSVTGLVVRLLEAALASRQRYEQIANQELVLLEQGLGYQLADVGVTWSRDELHED